MENMAAKVIGSYETRNVSRDLMSQVFYRNPKKAFKEFSAGMDVNVNKNAWQWVSYYVKVVRGRYKFKIYFRISDLSQKCYM